MLTRDSATLDAPLGHRCRFQCLTLVLPARTQAMVMRCGNRPDAGTWGRGRASVSYCPEAPELRSRGTAHELFDELFDCGGDAVSSEFVADRLAGCGGPVGGRQVDELGEERSRRFDPSPGGLLLSAGRTA